MKLCEKTSSSADDIDADKKSDVRWWKRKKIEYMWKTHDENEKSSIYSNMKWKFLRLKIKKYEKLLIVRHVDLECENEQENESEKSQMGLAKETWKLFDVSCLRISLKWTEHEVVQGNWTQQ